MTKKTKNQTIFEYLDSLQTEYIVTELRKKICFITKIKETYKGICERKREKIENISMKNRLPNIFTDNRLEREFYNRIYREWGLPHFTYTDDRDKRSKYVYDVKNYFSIDAEVKVLEDHGVIKVGTITDNQYVIDWFEQNPGEDISDKTVIAVKIKGSDQTQVTLISRVARIL